MPRTQAERRATTRAALRDATVSCLAELGYSGTTTTEIVKRAGVSRGAQVHHFPTKDVLVISAVEQLFDRRLEEYAKAFALVPDGQRDAATAIDLLWPMFDGPSFVAWLELVVAGRTNPALHAELQAVTARFDEHVAELFMDLFPGAPAEPLTDSLCALRLHRARWPGPAAHGGGRRAHPGHPGLAQGAGKRRPTDHLKPGEEVHAWHHQHRRRGPYGHRQ